MGQSRSFFNIVRLDDNYSGGIICTNPTWDGKMYRIPRDELTAYKGEKDLAQCGIYFLVGEDSLYIGQANARKNGNGILGRVLEHRKAAESFWNEAFLMISKTNSIGATELNYLENQLCNRALAAGGYKVVNAADPSTGHYSEMTEAIMELFMEGAADVFGLLRYPILSSLQRPRIESGKPDVEPDKPEEELYYIKRDKDPARIVDAICRKEGDEYYLLKGSVVAQTPTASCGVSVRRRRSEEAKKIDRKGVLKADLLFSTPSEASAFALYAASNGFRDWKNAEGLTLRETLPELGDEGDAT